jgi:hypothetical protein
LLDLEINVMGKKELKRTVSAPSKACLTTAGELLSVELGADEDVQWTWCHHGERGSSVIGYTIVTLEPIEVPEKRTIGFFSLEKLDGPVDPDADRSWLEEVQRRSAALDAGLMTSSPAAEVFERIRSRLKQ